MKKEKDRETIEKGKDGEKVKVEIEEEEDE